MYLSFFRLKDLPFNLTPDPRFLFMSTSHQEAFDHLLFGINERRGFIEVVGGIGTGKTTLCRALVEELGDNISTALVFNSLLSEIELLRAINDDFGIKSKGSGAKELIDELNKFLIRQLADGKNACLILDECQNLSVRVLELIRMLSNLETQSEKLLQIVMVGQPEFHQMLKSPRLRQLDERINVRSFLKPLNEEDTQMYIQHRLSVAGSRGDIQFKDGALQVIYSYSRGNPRRINQICDRCLLVAFIQGRYRITRDHAKLALQEILNGNRTKALVKQARASDRRPVVGKAMLALLGVAGIAGGWVFGQTMLPGDLFGLANGRMVNAQVQTQQSSIISEYDKIPDYEGGFDNPAPENVPDESAPSGDLFLPKIDGFALPAEGESLEQAARLSGNKLLHLTVNREIITRFKRPCVVELTNGEGGSERLGLLAGFSDTGVWINGSGEDLRMIPSDEFTSTWSGNVWLLLPSYMDEATLDATFEGTAVHRLKEQLGRLGYWQGEPTGSYDESLERAVAAFQKDMQLAENGMADIRTRALIDHLLDGGGGA